MQLGYERLVNDKRIVIEIEESDDPLVIIKAKDYSECIRFKASDALKVLNSGAISCLHEEIIHIAKVVNQTYDKANKLF